MDVERVRCFIPVGGQAKRLRPLTNDIAKPCIRFLNRPLIEFPMAELSEQGIRRFIFGEYGFTNYTNLFDQFGEGVGFSAKYKIEPRVDIKHQPNLDDLGSADSYRLNMQYYEVDDHVLVVQGDNLFQIDLESFATAHEEKGALMTIAITPVKAVEEFGITDLDKDLRVKRFVEKPQPGTAPGNLANAGIYMLSPEVRRIVESGEVREITERRHRLDFGFDLIPYLIEKGYPVYGYEVKVWYDIGNPAGYLEAMCDVLNGKVDIRVSEGRILPDRNVWVQGYSEESIKRRNEIVRKYNENKLSLGGSILIGRHVNIGDHSTITESSIDNYCSLGEHLTVERSAVMDAVRIGDYCTLSDSIVGRKAVIESRRETPTRIKSTSVIGNAARIMAGCTLIGTKVNPGLTIPQGMTYVNQFLEDYEDVVHLATKGIPAE